MTITGNRHPGKRFKKKPGESVVKLSKDDIDFLKRNTRYSEKEIKEWFSGFIDVCPGGQIDRQSIADIYAMPRRNADKFIDQMFKLFDMDGDGNISFRVSSDFWPFLFSFVLTLGIRLGHKPHYSRLSRGETQMGF